MKLFHPKACKYKKVTTFAPAIREITDTQIRIDSLAQQVEHNTFNVGVLGSSPGGSTQTKNKTMKTADNQSLSAVFFIHTAN